MEMTQVYNLTNTIYTEITGKSGIVTEDLSNVVDIGKEIFGATSVDKYTGSLIDHIGRMVFVDRPYKGIAPSVVMDAWEYGAVLELSLYPIDAGQRLTGVDCGWGPHAEKKKQNKQIK